jgi:hypothetical protein
VLILGGWARAVDCDLTDSDGWWHCANVTEAELWNWTKSYDEPAAECCPAGGIVNAVWPFTLLKDHTRAAYYFVGLIAFCLVYGICVAHRGGMCLDSAGNCCFGRVRGMRAIYSVACCCVGTVALRAAVFALLGFALVFTFAGAMAAAMAMSLLVQRSIQRHMHIVHKRQMATHFIVEDLSGQGDGCRTLAEVLNERGGSVPAALRRSQVVAATVEIRAAGRADTETQADAEAGEGATHAAEGPDAGGVLPVAAGMAGRTSVGGRAVIDPAQIDQMLRDANVR